MNNKYVLGFLFDKSLSRVLLLNKNRGPIEKLKGRLNGCGGRWEDGEDAASAMRRESIEETGLDLDWCNYASLGNSSGFSMELFYSVSDKIYDFQQKEDEIYDIYSVTHYPQSRFFPNYLNPIYPYEQFPHMENLQWMIPMALNH